jgi:hypothetical protein
MPTFIEVSPHNKHYFFAKVNFDNVLSVRHVNDKRSIIEFIGGTTLLIDRLEEIPSTIFPASPGYYALEVFKPIEGDPDDFDPILQKAPIVAWAHNPIDHGPAEPFHSTARPIFAVTCAIDIHAILTPAGDVYAYNEEPLKSWPNFDAWWADMAAPQHLPRLVQVAAQV